MNARISRSFGTKSCTSKTAFSHPGWLSRDVIATDNSPGPVKTRTCEHKGRTCEHKPLPHTTNSRFHRSRARVASHARPGVITHTHLVRLPSVTHLHHTQMRHLPEPSVVSLPSQDAEGPKRLGCCPRGVGDDESAIDGGGGGDPVLRRAAEGCLQPQS
jgi:hypothetical protein